MFAIFYWHIVSDYNKFFTFSISTFVILSTIVGILLFDAWKNYKYAKYTLKKDHVEYQSYNKGSIEIVPLSDFSGFEIKYVGNVGESNTSKWNQYKIYLVHEDIKKSFPFARYEDTKKKEEVVFYLQSELNLKPIFNDTKKRYFNSFTTINKFIAICLVIAVIYKLFG